MNEPATIEEHIDRYGWLASMVYDRDYGTDHEIEAKAKAARTGALSAIKELARQAFNAGRYAPSRWHDPHAEPTEEQFTAWWVHTQGTNT